MCGVQASKAGSPVACWLTCLPVLCLSLQDRTGITASSNAITYRPKYHYVVGANFGSGLVGLNTNTPFAP